MTFSATFKALSAAVYAHSGALALANFKRHRGTPKTARHEAVNSPLLHGFQFTKASFPQSELNKQKQKQPTITWWGKTILFSLRIMNCGPCFVGTSTVTVYNGCSHVWSLLLDSRKNICQHCSSSMRWFENRVTSLFLL